MSRRLVVVGCAVAAAGWLPASAEAYSASYEQRVTTRGQVIHSKVHVQDERFRMESEMDGQTSVVIRNEDGLFSYLPD